MHASSGGSLWGFIASFSPEAVSHPGARTGFPKYVCGVVLLIAPSPFRDKSTSLTEAHEQGAQASPYLLPFPCMSLPSSDVSWLGRYLPCSWAPSLPTASCLTIQPSNLVVRTCSHHWWGPRPPAPAAASHFRDLVTCSCLHLLWAVVL